MATTATIAVYSSSRSQPMNQPIELAERHVAVGVGGAGPRDHAGELRVGQRGARRWPGRRSGTRRARPADPALVPLATGPASEKMPTPMMPPTPIAVSCHRPSDPLQAGARDGLRLLDVLDGLPAENAFTHAEPGHVLHLFADGTADGGS